MARLTVRCPNCGHVDYLSYDGKSQTVELPCYKCKAAAKALLETAKMIKQELSDD